MANTIVLKNRIKSVRNTRQITKAMELVSASKMRRAQEAAARSRDFYRLASQLLTRLRTLMNVNTHPLFVSRTIHTKVYIVVTSDRGLAGAYNSNILRRLTSLLQADTAQGIIPELILVGKQGAKFAARLDGVKSIAVYPEFTGRPSANDIAPILQTITDMYTNRRADAVDILYTDYISSIRQEVTVARLLPIAFTEVPISHDLDGAEFEPSPAAVLEQVADRFLEVLFVQTLVEAQASEHSMRMLAMKNASDNASDIIDDLTLAFNTARQASITQEIAEITGGAEAIQ